jgi:hypothetical protein
MLRETFPGAMAIAGIHPVIAWIAARRSAAIQAR